ncbi:hypothetical protein O7631_27920 [Micromonospora sp. WMMD967]|uniref:hypothetical protein n=1 Tax=Micromonospora sp. WMMD967 TaxID=3016101 RepID=UPI00241600FF|nr:hypothetical protein [Micromonospora sp. WMMD967]MDG4840370.1 hypothetical protein [Micromonospora sp. WMMD967]
MVVGITRHLAGMAAAWLTFVAQSVAVYFGLLLFAVVTGSGLGGPLAGPVLALAAAVAGVALLPLLFLPAVAIGQAVGRSRGTGRVVALSTIAAVVLAIGYAVVGAVLSEVSARYVPVVAVVAALLVVAPVVMYALSAEGVGWMARRRRGPAVGLAAEPG